VLKFLVGATPTPLFPKHGVLGGQNGAATRLGLPRTTSISKTKRLGIDPGQSSTSGASHSAGTRHSMAHRTADLHKKVRGTKLQLSEETMLEANTDHSNSKTDPLACVPIARGIP